MINVSKEQLEIIKAILQKHLPDCEVRVFGSRLTDQIKSYSDLDLALIAPEKLSRQQMIKLKEAFAESDLPFRVDLLDWQKITAGFKEIINKNYEVLQP